MSSIETLGGVEDVDRAENAKSMTLIVTKGTLDWAYPPFILATTAAAMDVKVSMFFTFYGLQLLKKDLDHLQITTLGNPGMEMPMMGMHMTMPNIMSAMPGADALTLRTGISHNSQTFNDDQVLFNILAPGVVRTHASVGATYQFSKNHAVNFSFTRAFSDSVTGTSVNTGTQTIKLRMDQYDGVIGYT